LAFHLLLASIWLSLVVVGVQTQIRGLVVVVVLVGIALTLELLAVALLLKAF